MHRAYFGVLPQKRFWYVWSSLQTPIDTSSAEKRMIFRSFRLVLDISRHIAVYESVLRALCAIALVPALHDLLTEDSGDSSGSLKSMLIRLKDCIQVYVSKLKYVYLREGAV